MSIKLPQLGQNSKTLIPEPIQLLRELGSDINKTYHQLLYGDLTERPSNNGNPFFEFYIGITNHQYRYLLFSIETSWLPGFNPVKIFHGFTGNVMTVHTQDQFQSEIEQIMNDTNTVYVLERMLKMAQTADKAA